MQERLKVEFENLANRIMKDNSNELIKTSQTNLGMILNPLKTTSRISRKGGDSL